ncbi:unnamed protein product [Cylicocyclus nassatus]|uniref:Uncharacterized protein n=1 Tax=Cylicocyclus nassatus TaxID=53992 RepID=A0AA36GTT9_CYLNA|nr:unnamed protein product [Cylicocyclus nassatus]
MSLPYAVPLPESEEDLLDVELDYEEDAPVTEVLPAAAPSEPAAASRKRPRRSRPQPPCAEPEDPPKKKAYREDDTKKMFYAIIDALDEQRRRQQRLEDQQDRIEALLNAVLKQGRDKASACPKVLPTRYCDVCDVAGHQAADCRNKTNMDPARVERRYKKKGICKKCHCIHL